MDKHTEGGSFSSNDFSLDSVMAMYTIQPLHPYSNGVSELWYTVTNNVLNSARVAQNESVGCKKHKDAMMFIVLRLG